MAVLIKQSDFEFYEIDKEYRENFKSQRWTELSDFDAEALKWVGNVIRPLESVYFWNDGTYSWYVDKKQSHEQRVWLTKNNILMFEDCTKDKLYRVGFKK